MLTADPSLCELYVFQVENLFRIYHDKRSSRIAKRHPSDRRKEEFIQEEDRGGEEARMANTQDKNRLPSESDAG